ncbi:Periplasmic serine proteases (ClpP class) [Caballeronia sordidicola]|uniref:Periplasmic serine proteases (ClpP class) n=1 Tax=Caballeronia sordidicola TaxID=196367 RepID=A0A226XA07_CABSO|nr:Periplasmic serine proteases (ClpP class) [Caballeronia sordidicola]
MARFTSRTRENASGALAAARVCGGWQRKIATHPKAAPSSGFPTTISVRLDRSSGCFRGCFRDSKRTRSSFSISQPGDACPIKFPPIPRIRRVPNPSATPATTGSALRSNALRSQRSMNSGPHAAGGYFSASCSSPSWRSRSGARSISPATKSRKPRAIRRWSNWKARSLPIATPVRTTSTQRSTALLKTTALQR